MTAGDHGPTIPASARIATAAKGGYAVLLRLGEDHQLKIGRLGAFEFPAGYYLYFGSALGGLDARVRRHLKRAKKRHWHIDHVSAVASAVQVWWASGTERLEGAWARAVLDLPGVSAPAPGFGSSDCSCPSHLALLPDTPCAVESARERVRTSQTGIGLQVTPVGAVVAGGTGPGL